MLRTIAVEKIVGGSNVRDEQDETLLELMASIETNGLLSPITVRHKGDKYEVIAGHRRLEAVKRLGEPFIECLIKEDVSDKDYFVMQVEENIQRKNMSAYEIVKCFDHLKEKYGCTDKQIGALFHKNTQWVADQRYAVKLLEHQYQNGIPEEKKKLSASMIKATVTKKKQGEAIKTIGNGFSCKQHGHTYMIYCNTFEFEQKLQQLIESCK